MARPAPLFSRQPQESRIRAPRSSSSLVVGLTGLLHPAPAHPNIIVDAFEAYQDATGGVLDENVGLLSITPAQFDALESLFFHIGDVGDTSYALSEFQTDFSAEHL